MENANISKVETVYVKDDEVFNFVDNIIDEINEFQDYDLIERNDKREFWVNIETSNRIDELLEEDNEISITEEKLYKEFQKLIFKIDDMQEHFFIVTPK